jgi:dolichyl-diphosphooligosaccharide--protein glycosyltransferase
MVRLMLTLTPVVCVAASIAVSTLLDTYVNLEEPETHDRNEPAPAVSSTTTATQTSISKKAKKSSTPSQDRSTLGNLIAGAASSTKKGDKTAGIYGPWTRLIVVSHTITLLVFFVLHCTWTTAFAYSSPSVVLASHARDGSMNIIDDYREAYYWLRQNTPESSVIMSWWDYGYQIAGFSNRTTLVDNNTWNNSAFRAFPPWPWIWILSIAHIATVGKAMASTEEVAYPILRKHDVDYVLVIFGGVIGYSGDDINKFLWMVRISQGVWPNEISEPDYFTPQGDYRVDEHASTTMKNCLMYKMSYYRFVSSLFVS